MKKIEINENGLFIKGENINDLISKSVYPLFNEKECDCNSCYKCYLEVDEHDY